VAAAVAVAAARVLVAVADVVAFAVVVAFLVAAATALGTAAGVGNLVAVVVDPIISLGSESVVVVGKSSCAREGWWVAGGRHRRRGCALAVGCGCQRS